MAITPDAITIRIDQDEINRQVQDAVKATLVEIASRFRAAAFDLDPAGANEHTAWLYTRGYDHAEAGKPREYVATD